MRVTEIIIVRTRPEVDRIDIDISLRAPVIETFHYTMKALPISSTPQIIKVDKVANVVDVKVSDVYYNDETITFKGKFTSRTFRLPRPEGRIFQPIVSVF